MNGGEGDEEFRTRRCQDSDNITFPDSGSYECASKCINAISDIAIGQRLALKPRRLGRRRQPQGRLQLAPGVEVGTRQRQVRLDEEGKISEIRVRERLDAHRVVEDFMIAANVAAAKALESKVAPVVYRIHEPPSREKLVALKDYLSTFDRKLALGQVITPSLFNRMLKDVADDTEKALIMEAVLRSQTQAYYGPSNAGHFGLALASYAHFTSPIRRYADLLVHRALVDAYKLEQPAPKNGLPEASGLSERDRADLSKVSDAISKAERRAMEAERETIDRYVAAWLSGRVGEVFPTRITGVQSFGFFATIVGLGGDGLIPVSTLGRVYFMYDEGFKWWNLGSGAAVAFLLFLCILGVTLVQLRLAKRGGAI